MAYDLTVFNTTSIQNLQTTITQINLASGNLIGTLILFSFWVGYFMMFKKEDSAKDFMISSFVTSIFAFLLAFKGWIPGEIIAIPLTVTLVSYMMSGFK